MLHKIKINYNFYNIMEFLLIGGLAFIGYEISKSPGKVQEATYKKIERNANEYPFKSDARISTNPANMPFDTQQPYFRREGGMSSSMNNQIKTRTLENFTGNNNLDFQSKKEQVCLFKPSENVQNIYGTPALSDETYNRYKSSTMMNNVSPIEKQQVGPGLNTSGDVAAKGGFHQYFRILPTNVGDYKNNTLEGRVISGKGITENRTSNAVQEVYKPKTYYEQSEHPTMAGKSAFSAATHQSVITPDVTNRENFHEHLGIAKGADALQSSQNVTRVGNVPLRCLPQGGASRENAATGSYSVANYLVHETDRENCGVVTNANDQSSGNYVKGSQIANMTQREGTSTSYSGAAGFYNNAQSNYSTAYNADVYHNREDLQVEYTNNPGRMNLREDPYNIVNSMKVRDDAKSQRVNIATVPNSMRTQGKPGRIENAPKVTESNPRQDFGLISKTLENNPYVHR
jgi:hypothetical protein